MRTAFKFAIGLATVVSALGQTSYAQFGEPEAKQTIAEIAKESGLTTLNSLLQKSSLDLILDTPSKKDRFTVFAPSNEAFAKLPKEVAARIINNPAVLRAVLLNHVAAGEVRAQKAYDLSNGSQNFALPTAGGQQLIISSRLNDVPNSDRKEIAISVNAANVIAKDIRASNGVIHIVDQVLLPRIVIDIFAPDFCSKPDGFRFCTGQLIETGEKVIAFSVGASNVSDEFSLYSLRSAVPTERGGFKLKKIYEVKVTGCYLKSGDPGFNSVPKEEQEFFFERNGEKLVRIDLRPDFDANEGKVDMPVTAQRDVFFRGADFPVPPTVSPERANQCVRFIDYR